jgi:hypothetical protein
VNGSRKGKSQKEEVASTSAKGAARTSAKAPGKAATAQAEKAVEVADSDEQSAYDAEEGSDVGEDGEEALPAQDEKKAAKQM